MRRCVTVTLAAALAIHSRRHGHRVDGCFKRPRQTAPSQAPKDSVSGDMP